MAEKNKKIVNEENTGNNIVPKGLDSVLHDSMMPYAEYVILDRALPRVEDGLKPVQRRILYTMMELSLEPDKPYRKSARIVGDCLGKYHPHGDTSVYDAMVRMAQPFNQKELLVDGHGNYGSVDGDSPAAMRYTEAKLTPLAMELLRDIDMDTVKFNLNFDDTLKEPDTLPGRFPNLLVNGATGIAVGLATNIPPHNLAEVIDGVIAYIDNSKINLHGMMKYIKGPDFPTGGYVAYGTELERAYETGKGKITMRAKVYIEQGDYDKKNIVITEIPYQVNKASLLQSILNLKEEKKEQMGGVIDIVDESDRNGMRAIIKLKKDADPQAILKFLYKQTDLEKTFGINIVAVADGKPQQMGLLDIIHYYVNYQREVILRRSKYELADCKEREHILEGLVIAVKNIDEVIKIIRKSANTSEARQALCKRFNLSERQSQAILDMRLARLTALEIQKLEAELKELKERIAYLTKVVANKNLQLEIVKNELSEIKKKYKSPRKTELVITTDNIVTESFDDYKEVEDCVVILSHAGSLKKISEKSYNQAQKEINEKTAAHELVKYAVKTQSNYVLYCFSNFGNCFKLNVEDLPECKFKDKGSGLKTLFTEAVADEYITAIYPVYDGLPQGALLFMTREGFVKKSDWSEYNIIKPYFQAMKLKEGDEIINIETDIKDTSLLFVTKKAMCLNADKSDIPTQGRIAVGVRGIALSEGDGVLFCTQVNEDGEIVIISSINTAKRVVLSCIDVLARYRKGVKISEISDADSIIYASRVTEPYDIVIEEEGGEMSALNTEDISIESRTAKGKFIKGKKSIKIANIYKKEDGLNAIAVTSK